MEDSPSCGISQIQTATSFVNGVVVSIHDVHPGSQVIVEEILRDLVLVGVTETSLLVVPNWHGKYPISAHPEFLTWVRSKIKSHEVVMHGCFHRRDELKGQRSIIDNVVTKFYTAGEGEFYDTSIEKTKKLIRTGLGYFESSGLKCKGFIAPAWLLGVEALRGLDECGAFLYTVTLRSVICLRRRTCYISQSLCYSTRAAWRRILSIFWNEFLLNTLSENPLIRISLHPPDWKFPAIKRHSLRCIQKAVLMRGRAMPYEVWLNKTKKIKILEYP